jgi:molybdate transport system substrate-binding protein
MIRRFLFVGLVCGLFTLSACGGSAPSVSESVPTEALQATEAQLSGELTVFAAASLTAAFTEAGANFEAQHPNTKIIFQFAGSDQLAEQIMQGAPADVFASANSKQMEKVVEGGEVASDASQIFAHNRLVVVYPSDNPGQISSLLDLAKPKLKLVLASPSVPVGAYSLAFLEKAAALPDYTESYSPTVLANVVSYEDSVKAVFSKVALGEADAGIVYATDVSPESADKVQTLEIPNELNTVANYPIAPTMRAAQSEVAAAFVAYMLSPEGQAILATYGFVPAND